MGNEPFKNYYSEEKINMKFNSDWMSFITDDTLISSLTIPGTHNSCANCSSWIGFG